MNLASAFTESVQRHPQKTAVFWGEQEISYGALHQMGRRLSRQLRDHFSVKPGERVGLWLRNCPEFVAGLLGILDAGGVVVPINNFLKPDEVAYILKDAGISVLITEAGSADAQSALRAMHPELKCWHIESFAELPASTDRVEDVGRGPDDLAVIIYTSGTTGRPKGAMLSHGNLLANVNSCRQVLAAVEADRFVVLLPMFHSFMLCVGIFLPLLVGGSFVLVKSIHPPKNVVQDIVRHQASILPAIPQFFRSLAAAAPPNLPVRVCISGAAPLPGEVLREFEAKMSMPLLEGYGLSEASPVVSMNPLTGPWKAGSIGVPIPDVEMSVQNELGELLPCGEVGEICVRGGNVMRGYWNNESETRRVLRNGWLLTGDVGYCDADGYYFITDRKKDMLLVNGINVYPREIEEVLYQFPGVQEAAVIGMADARRGEVPLAFVSPQEGVVLEEKAILAFVRQRMADYKVPRRVEILPALPRNATGKVLKTALRQLPAARASEASEFRA